MSYRNDVAEAKRLVKQSEEHQWRLAELTWTVVETGTSRRQWARDVGMSSSHANYLFRVWERWGDAHTGVRPTFWDAYRKVHTGDDSATATGARADEGIKHASPRAIAKAVAERPEYRRAIADND